MVSSETWKLNLKEKQSLEIFEREVCTKENIRRKKGRTNMGKKNKQRNIGTVWRIVNK
jgi:hypothetical protein